MRLEPVAVKCNCCEEYSQYNVKYHIQLPTGWVFKEDVGVFCNKCKPTKKGKLK